MMQDDLNAYCLGEVVWCRNLLGRRLQHVTVILQYAKDVNVWTVISSDWIGSESQEERFSLFLAK